MCTENQIVSSDNRVRIKDLSADFLIKFFIILTVYSVASELILHLSRSLILLYQPFGFTFTNSYEVSYLSLALKITLFLPLIPILYNVRIKSSKSELPAEFFLIIDTLIIFLLVFNIVVPVISILYLYSSDMTVILSMILPAISLILCRSFITSKSRKNVALIYAIIPLVIFFCIGYFTNTYLTGTRSITSGLVQILSYVKSLMAIFYPAVGYLIVTLSIRYAALGMVK